MRERMNEPNVELREKDVCWTQILSLAARKENRVFKMHQLLLMLYVTTVWLCDIKDSIQAKKREEGERSYTTSCNLPSGIIVHNCMHPIHPNTELEMESETKTNSADLIQSKAMITATIKLEVCYTNQTNRQTSNTSCMHMYP